MSLKQTKIDHFPSKEVLMIIRNSKWLSRCVAAIGLAIFAFALSTDAQIITTTVVDDNLAVDGTAITDARYYGTSSGSGAIDIDPNGIGLVTGSSGRQLHALFPTQTLGMTGDTLSTVLTFLTPATVPNLGSDDIRIGLFDHLGRGNIGGVLDQNISASSSTPNPDLIGLPGYAVELDVDPATVTNQDVNLRRSDPSTTGRLLGTNTGIPNFSSSGDNGYVFAPNTSYTLEWDIERDASGGLLHTINFLDSAGVLIDTHSDTDSSPNSFDFGFLGFGASTNAFGSSNSNGTPDNGLDITNLSIEFSTTVPEPGSAALLLALGSFGLVRRRRRK